MPPGCTIPYNESPVFSKGLHSCAGARQLGYVFTAGVVRARGFFSRGAGRLKPPFAPTPRRLDNAVLLTQQADTSMDDNQRIAAGPQRQRRFRRPARYCRQVSVSVRYTEAAAGKPKPSIRLTYGPAVYSKGLRSCAGARRYAYFFTAGVVRARVFSVGAQAG